MSDRSDYFIRPYWSQLNLGTPYMVLVGLILAREASHSHLGALTGAKGDYLGCCPWMKVG